VPGSQFSLNNQFSYISTCQWAFEVHSHRCFKRLLCYWLYFSSLNPL